MRLYLVQHGISKSKLEDPERPLTETGIQQTELIASYLKNHKIKLDKIYHSEKRRAAQTAEIIAGKIDIKYGLVEDKDLNPLTKPEIWSEKIKTIDDDIMIIGHLPHLNNLTSLLLGYDENLQFIFFKNSGVICMDREDDSWSLKWLITPDLIV